MNEKKGTPSLRRRRARNHSVLTTNLFPLLHLPLANLFRSNSSHTPDEGTMTRQEFGGGSLVWMQMSAGFAEEERVLGETRVRGQEERGAAGAIAEVHGAALR